MAPLLVLEGPDGVGKSTIAARLREALSSRGVSAHVLSFPGKDAGTLGRLIYDVHHDPRRFDVRDAAPASLQILHIAAHVDAIQRRLLPMLRAGETVVLDRYWWSTWVYGIVAGVEPDLLEAMLGIERAAWQGMAPALVVLLRRAVGQQDLPRYESLVNAYGTLASRERSNHAVHPVENVGAIELAVAEIVRAFDLATASANSAVGLPDLPLFSTVTPRTSPVVRERSARTPTVFSKLAPAVPSKVYDTLWRFACERQAIYFRRFRGTPGPLTHDPIIREHKFTNAYRASDRVSQYLIRDVLYAGDQSPREAFFRTVLFKLFNKIETWQLLVQSVGEVSYSTYAFKRYDAVLSAALARGTRIYSAAYVMPAASAFGPDLRKHRTHLRLLEKLMADHVPSLLVDCKSMRDGFELLRSYPMLGNFLAYQYVTDLNYGTLTDFSETEFVVPGPGARDGLRKCFASAGGLSEADLIRLLADRQEFEFERLGLNFETLWGRRLQLIDCQNLLCEVDKYARVAHPDVAGISGRSRIKQRYRASPDPHAYWYPPKWNLNERIEAEVASLRAQGMRGGTDHANYRLADRR